MKLKNLLFLLPAVVLFAGCKKWVNSPDAYAIPVVQAVANNDLGDLECMLPDGRDLQEIYAANGGFLGAVFYNKYSEDYREAHLKGQLVADMNIIHYLSKTNDLDWNSVQIGNVSKEDINDSASSYTRVTVPLRFSKGDWQFQFNTIRHQSGMWYLVGGLYLTKPTK